MSELEGIVTYTFKWISTVDARTCRKCRGLHGYVFQGQDLFQNVLWHPIWGDVWDLDADHSLAHGNQPHNCRCRLHVDAMVDLSKATWFLQLSERVWELAK
jgi:hypothetical protein